MGQNEQSEGGNGIESTPEANRPTECRLCQPGIEFDPFAAGR